MSDVTDELIAKLHDRREHGVIKYEKTLLPFDGRNTERDIEEELLDGLVYVTKMRMERAAVAEMLERAGQAIDWFSGKAMPPTNEPLIPPGELREMANKLRADVWRIGDDPK